MDNGLYWRTYEIETEVWSDWNIISGSTSDTPAATILDNELHLVVKGFGISNILENQTLWHGIISLGDDSFQGWNYMQGSTNAAPILTTSESLGTLELGVRGMDGEIYLNEWNGVSWQGWTLITGLTSDSPGITAIDNNLRIVVKSYDNNNLWYCNFDLLTDIQTGWTMLSGSTPSAPIMTS